MKRYKTLKAVWITITKSWDFVVSWRKDWRFIGFVKDFGFGRYIGIKF